MRIALLVCVFFCFDLPGFAQPFKGRVLDAFSKEPLAGATIEISGTSRGSVTNEKGKFILSDLSGSFATLIIRSVGYKTTRVEVQTGNTVDLFLYPDTVLGEDVLVQSTKVDFRTPMTVNTVSKVVIERQNTGRDIPYVLQSAPSVVQTSDAGTGFGYTGLRIRGVDPTRINVTINGIPVNDAESQNVFWVNMPDLAASTGSVQIQRGVGASTNGSAAFGATINLETALSNPEPFASATTGIGSFGTSRFNLTAGSGLIKGFSIDGRISQTKSDGYIDRATADLTGYSFQATRFGKTSLTKILAFGGKEITYQAWYGTPQSRIQGDTAAMNAFADRNLLTDSQRQNLLQAGPTYNFYEYENQVDNYRQHHLQVHHSTALTDSLTWNGAFHYTRGRGFFEEFVPDADLQLYFESPAPGTLDAARRRWLDNHFYGLISGAERRNGASVVTAGGGVNRYDGLHFGHGQAIRGVPGFSGRRYYENTSRKTDANAFVKFSHSIQPGLSLYTDLQVRSVYYRFFGFSAVDSAAYQNVSWRFLNPKAGFVYQMNSKTRMYASFARGSREPGRDELINSTPQSRPEAEFLNNVEAGVERRFDRGVFQLNVYAMEYKNQLILTGEVNDVGAYIRENVPRSFRRGIELQTVFQPAKNLTWTSALTASRNRIARFTEYLDRYDDNFEPLAQQTTVFRNTGISFSPDLILNNSVRWVSGPVSMELLTKYVSRQFLDNRSDRQNSLAPYATTDLLLSWDNASLPGVRIFSLSAQMINIFNRSYSSNGYTFGYVVGSQTIRENLFYPQAPRHVLFQLRVSI